MFPSYVMGPNWVVYVQVEEGGGLLLGVGGSTPGGNISAVQVALKRCSQELRLYSGLPGGSKSIDTPGLQCSSFSGLLWFLGRG